MCEEMDISERGAGLHERGLDRLRKMCERRSKGKERSVNHMTKQDFVIKYFLEPQVRIYHFCHKKIREIYFCKDTAKERRNELKKSGTVTGLNTDWLEKKLFDYTSNSKENIFYARLEEDPKQEKNKVPVDVILYSDICYAVCFTIQDKKKVLEICEAMDSSGKKFSSKRKDLHSLVEDMQNVETKISYTGHPWSFVAPCYQVKKSATK